jgi:hypothetical protein
MPRIVIVIAALVLGLHGLIHLMGATVYLKLGEVQGLAYKTTILGGRVDLGDVGIAVFGALWILPALGFVAAALGLLEGWDWWKLALLATTLVSAVLTVLDWNVAFMGAIVDFAILGALWIQLQMVVPS